MSLLKEWKKSTTKKRSIDRLEPRTTPVIHSTKEITQNHKKKENFKCRFVIAQKSANPGAVTKEAAKRL